jgi:programmed cell death protein 5
LAVSVSVSTLKLAKPEKAQMVESMLINMARSGQIREKIGEQQLKGLLEQVSERTKTTTKVKVRSRSCPFLYLQ